MMKYLLQMSERNQHYPFLAVRDLYQNQSCHLQQDAIPEALVQATLQCVGRASMQMINLDILLCVWICR